MPTHISPQSGRQCEDLFQFLEIWWCWEYLKLSNLLMSKVDFEGGSIVTDQDPSLIKMDIG